MRIFLFAGIAVAAAVSSAMIPTPARAGGYPFCIKGEGYVSPVGDCSFNTYQQCQATASGRLNYCQANPYYADPKPVAAAPRKRSRAY